MEILFCCFLTISIRPILFLYYEESLVSSNLNSKLFRFHRVRPSYHSGLSTLKKYQCHSMGLHEFFHHSAIVSCITFHVWKSVDCYFSNKVYKDILRNSYVLRKTLKCLCTLYLKNSNLQNFIHEKICMKL